MASSKKRNAIDLNWMEQHIVSKIPKQAIEDSEKLKLAVEEFNEKKDILPTLPASSLEIEDVCQIFDLQYEDVTVVFYHEEELLQVPAELESAFNKLKVILGQDYQKNEALARCYINMVVFNCVLEERLVTQPPQPPAPTISSTSISLTSTIPLRSHQKSSAKNQPKPAPIGLYFKTELKQKVIYKDCPYILSGLADYSLGYKDSGSGSGNLVIVMAKRRHKIGNAYGELLAYMGMIHEARKKEKGENAVIYGVATDGFDYRFWRIDNTATVSMGKIYDWTLAEDRQSIYTMFRAITRTAILLSPTKSEVVSDLFRGSGSSEFDFGAAATWENIVTWEKDPNIEFIDMSS